VPVSPTAFLTLHRALANRLIASLDEFYTASRTILVKSERYFDLFDQVFAHHFQGPNCPTWRAWRSMKWPGPCWSSGSRTPRPWPMPWAWMKTS
jgi:uncharacterized protein with von Willebrand factor type A (vWA) domain